MPEIAESNVEAVLDAFEQLQIQRREVQAINRELLDVLRLALPAVAMHTPDGARAWPDDTPMTRDDEVDLAAIAVRIRAIIERAEGRHG